MNRGIIITISILLLIGVFLISIYFITFASGLSDSVEVWSNSGGYFSGTIGIVFSLIGSVLLYQNLIISTDQLKLSKRQEHQMLENQSISNYYLLVSNIRENFLHLHPPHYNEGREIFGNFFSSHVDPKIKSLAWVKKTNFLHNQYPLMMQKITNDQLENEELDCLFEQVCSMHISVFQHYCAALAQLYSTLKTNNSSTVALISHLSYYEKMFLIYYFGLYCRNKGLEVNNEFNSHLLASVSLEIIESDGNEHHKKVCRYIYRKLTELNEQ